MISLCKKAMTYIVSSFTSVEFYRDVAYRETGFGFKTLWMVFVLLFIPSVFHYIYKIHDDLNHQWREDIVVIPHLKLIDGQVIKQNQDQAVVTQIQQLSKISWLGDNQIPRNVNENIDYFLGSHYFLLRVPTNNWFGFQFSNKDLFLPVVAWIHMQEPINGQKIYEALGSGVIVVIISLFLVFNLAIMLNFCFFFVYSFSFVASTMIRFIINDYHPDRKMVCRLLSISMIPTLVFAAIIMDLLPYRDYHKYMYIFLYMLNFNIAVRLVRKKSNMTSLDLGKDSTHQSH